MVDRTSTISVQDVKKTFHPVVAVDRVSFEVSTGEIFGHPAPRGGKSHLR